MTYRCSKRSPMLSKYPNRKLTTSLLLFTLIGIMMVRHLSTYYDTTSAKDQRILLHFSETFSHEGSLKYSNSINSETHFVPESRKYSDSSYAALREYHNRGIALRKQFSCIKLFEGKADEQEKVIRFHNLNNGTYTITASEEVPEIMADCQAFKTIRGYKMDAGSKEEEEFPLAYVIVVHKDFEHLERLLRIIYKPQHSICIHLDAKSSDSLKQAVTALVRCFPNVIMASQPQKVIYAHMSRLMADIVCMKDLLAKDKRWRYLINYAAMELPLRSNLETVKILQTLHGLNDIHEQYKRRVESRFNREYIVADGRVIHTRTPLVSPPHNLTIIKGQAYNTFSRAFLEWTFKDKKPGDFLNWCNKTYSPDEHYWATLNDLYHNPFLKTPGGFGGHPDKKGYISRYINWQYNSPQVKCQGRVVRHICIFSALDLPYIFLDLHLAANKFDLTFDPVPYACMEELMENKTASSLPFNLMYYKNLYFVNYKGNNRAVTGQ